MEVIAIDIQPQDERIDRWVDYWRSKKASDVTWSLDPGFAVGRQYGVIVLGQTVIIDREGKVAYNGQPLTERPLKQLLDEAM